MKLKQLKAKDIPELRKKILGEQKGICPICNREPDTPCLDHAHTKKLKLSGQIRGVLCLQDNVYLGKLENSCMRCGIKQKDLPTVLRRCADYLEKEQYPYLHPSEVAKKPILKKRSYNKLLTELKKIDFRNKVPIYRINNKEKKVQVLTKPLEKLFKKVNLEPEFY